ncbi:sortase-dependent protein [Streptomyces sp. NPDC000345]|uniref:sortase-dependent protein n=1 Tax=Streptomyces sp. NPDC000345 TaxID=3364537 RepID=UPI0036CEF0E0
MSRTGLAALALGTALLAGAAPAFADETATPVPSGTEAAEATPAPAEDRGAAPSAVPSQVGVVPRGAADTGVGETAEGHGGLIGGGAAAAVCAAAGAGVLVVRRRRATGA